MNARFEPTPSQRRRWFRDRRLWLVAALAVVLLVGAVVFLRGGDAGDEPEEVAEVEATVELVRVEPFAVTVEALGTVVPGPGAEARPAAPAQTRVTRVLVAAGDAVRTGQPLIVLDASVFRARLAEATTTFAAAQAAYERADRLVAQGISPRKDLEAATTEVAQARAALEEARRTQTLATVRSPITGIVTEVDVAIGQPVDANQPLIDIVDPRGLAILFHLSPDQAARIVPGADVALSATRPAGGVERPALGSGSVQGISAAVDSVTGSVEVRVVATTPTRVLRAGETVSGRITESVRARAVVVPLAALVPGDEGMVVFVVDDAGIAHETPVEVGERSETSAEILSGLQGGERVVTEGAYGVSDGAHVVTAGS